MDPVSRAPAVLPATLNSLHGAAKLVMSQGCLHGWGSQGDIVPGVAYCPEPLTGAGGINVRFLYVAGGMIAITYSVDDGPMPSPEEVAELVKRHLGGLTAELKEQGGARRFFFADRKRKAGEIGFLVLHKGEPLDLAKHLNLRELTDVDIDRTSACLLVAGPDVTSGDPVLVVVDADTLESELEYALEPPAQTIDLIAVHAGVRKLLVGQTSGAYWMYVPQDDEFHPVSEDLGYMSLFSCWLGGAFVGEKADGVYLIPEDGPERKVADVRPGFRLRGLAAGGNGNQPYMTFVQEEDGAAWYFEPLTLG
ncbi:MAG: hypothetical protein UY92_C0014G0019 [Candidatus Magasanikbacteria bacterium GW2011_GWA2_56_11]|uniref:Uncharacterized protein n=1 Tax=Candidatus Magasanikbacteria bacterium GW2011_GWA2_56_11 TaxID=1619044 RepID=A0A0G2B8E5_9BACT|nr:MAG: hypothetical protein UY92_C0014G0019 [Candidatus Magasanikbacteria bacterium GW2011_GWA2_56_11]